MCGTHPYIRGIGYTWIPCVLACVVSCLASPIRFNEINENKGYQSLGDFEGAYGVSIELPIDVDTSDGFAEWKQVSKQYEPFFGVSLGKPQISRVGILNASNTEFGDALILDKAAFHGNGEEPVPEPATALTTLAGVLYLWTLGRRRVC